MADWTSLTFDPLKPDCIGSGSPANGLQLAVLSQINPFHTLVVRVEVVAAVSIGGGGCGEGGGGSGGGGGVQRRVQWGGGKQEDGGNAAVGMG